MIPDISYNILHHNTCAWLCLVLYRWNNNAIVSININHGRPILNRQNGTVLWWEWYYWSMDKNQTEQCIRAQNNILVIIVMCGSSLGRCLKQQSRNFDTAPIGIVRVVWASILIYQRAFVVTVSYLLCHVHDIFYDTFSIHPSDTYSLFIYSLF